jgi:oxygen-independent coproporphyrinogen-3 oxidase
MPSIYIHIPFCIKKCAYCDFVSFENMPFMAQYCNALKAEMEVSAFCIPHISFDTVFLGGGTPSILPLGAIKSILDTLKMRFFIAENVEITMECNPGTVSLEKLIEYRTAGVNRLSFGLQSANDALLKCIGRIHTYDDFLKSYVLARDAGFSNINVDVMYGLPNQTVQDISETLHALFLLMPEHISAYSLILEEGTPLQARVERGEVSLPDEDEAYAQHRSCIEMLQNNGYERYEISNYARRFPDGKSPFRCKHNLNYWNNGEYLGVGLNAHSAMRLEGAFTRWNNTANLKEYLICTGSEALPIKEKQRIGKDEEMFEYVMLGLRKTDGIELEAFERRFHESVHARYDSALAKLVSLHWLEIANGFMRLTDSGLDMQNEALLYFMGEE